MKKNGRKFLTIVIGFCLSIGATFAQLSCYNIVGYYPSWVAGGNYYINSPSQIDYGKYTMIDYAFVIPGTSGSMGSVPGSSTLVDLVNRCHTNNVKIVLSVGGWLDSSPDNTPFETIANSSSAITTFVNACANLVTQYNLDGIDIDWEYPTTKTKWNNLIVPLADRIHSMGKLLTAAVSESAANSGDHYDNVSVLDLVNIMCYGSYSTASSSIGYWTGRGVPQSKRMMGVPFYSADNNTSEHVQKANLAKTTAGGIMIWDIASEYGDITSIYNTLGSVCGKVSAPGSSTIYEAENATLSLAATETTNGGYHGASYVNYNNVADSYVEWNVNNTNAGLVAMAIQFANAGTANRPMDIYVNGTKVISNLAFNLTGAWTTWTKQSFSVNLNAGNNTIRATATSADGGPNVDYLEVSSTVVPISNLALNKAVTASSEPQAENPASSAVDGNTDTRWSASVYPQSIEVDLGAVYSISRTELVCYSDRAYQFKVEAKTTTGTYTQVVDRTTNTTPGTVAAPIADNFGAVDARYVKLTVTGCPGYTGTWVSISEFSVFGGTLKSKVETPEPASYKQIQLSNFPNPFYQNTMISYILEKDGKINLRVSDITGATKKVVVDKYLSAGKYDVPCDFSDLSSGVYFITLKTEDLTKTIKVIHVK
jgi:GH18 family chitinase